MVRLVLLVAVAGAAFVLYTQRSAQTENQLASGPAVNTSGVPSQMRFLINDRPDPVAILRSRGALPGLGVIKQLTGGSHADDQDSAPAAGVNAFADVGTARQVALVKHDVRRDLTALNRLSHGGGAGPAAAAHTLAEVYSAPVLRALGPAGRRAFAVTVAGRTDDSEHIHVLAFNGVFVSGRHALAEVVYRLSVREPSGHFLPGAPQTWTVTLAHESGRWRFVRGFEQPA